MEWTPDLIRAKADAMERRLGQPVSEVGPDTLRLVVEALRFYAAQAFVDRRESYLVEVYDHRRGTTGEQVGAIGTLEAALLLYDWAVQTRPGAHVYIRKGGWVVRQARPSTPIPPAPGEG